MNRLTIAGATLVAGLALAGAAVAQSGQVGPAKTPNGSMPAAPSNSTPQSGSMSGSPMGAGTGAMNDNGGKAMAPRKARMTKKMRHSRKKQAM